MAEYDGVQPKGLVGHVGGHGGAMGGRMGEVGYGSDGQEMGEEGSQ